MNDAQPPDALLSQSLAVLRQCVPTLETAAARAPTVAVELQDTMAALRGVERALHQHRDALQRAEHFATLGRLAAGLSHEIRNPLGALFLHIDLLEEEFRDPTPESPTVILQTFGEIRTALTRLDELVQDYLSGTRQHHRAGRAGRGCRHTSVGGGDGAPRGSAGVTVELAGHTTRVPLAFHASTLRRAVLNVVQNAIEAMPNGGTLRLECVHTATEVQLRIRDSGVGMPAAQVPRIFEPLYTTKPGGTGLGLYIVREILVAHGGQVTVDSVEGAGHDLCPDVSRTGVTSARRLRCRDQPREGEIWRRTDAGGVPPSSCEFLQVQGGEG
jgi:signal transduction histidine kinase